MLSDLPTIRRAVTRSICAENPSGEKGGGARAVPGPDSPASALGQGWKARPCLTLPAGSTTVLADVDGPGVVRHIWITVATPAYRGCVLRMYWDGEAAPSVEVPLGDFFVLGHGEPTDLISAPICVNPIGGLNSYWPLPFRRHCRITVENRGEEVPAFFYQVTYELTDVDADAAYFHAQWRGSRTDRSHPEHVILDGVRGRGHYVGTALAWTQHDTGWWGEGEVKFYLDGDAEFPTICGTGTEDYACGAWGFAERVYSTPYAGYPLRAPQPDGSVRHSLYRWHVPDPVRFESDLRVTVQALGLTPESTYTPLADDIASVAYWYQAEPHAPFPSLGL